MMSPYWEVEFYVDSWRPGVRGYLVSKFDLLFIPRQDDVVLLNGDAYRVVDVIINLGSSDIGIRVDVHRITYGRGSQ
jgi:hypothetical protein